MLKFYMLTLCAILASLCGVSAQVVTTSPSPLQEDSPNVEIYFHADQGNKGLINQPASAEIYAHTGVSIIDAAGKASDWAYVPSEWNTNLPKCKLSFVSDNLWKLSIGDIRTFYGVPADVKITKLDFVFRNANGSLTGRSETGGDIFVDVADTGFQMALTASQPEGVVNGATGAVTFTLTSTLPASLSITVNDVELKTASGATTLTASYTFPSEGDYIVTAAASNGPGGEIKYKTLSYCYAGNSKPAASTQLPAMGATRNPDGSVTFCLAAPQKSSAMVVGSWDGYRYTNSQLMGYIDVNQDGATFRYFTLTIPRESIATDRVHTYFYLIDGTIQVADPYAHLVLDPFNDQYISPEVFPNLPQYPTDRLSGVPLAVIDDNLNAYNWQTTSFTPPAKTDLIIYELLLRDFTGTEGKADGNGTVRGAIAKIPYLKSLGINAVELLPINEFNGNISWGYNPNFYMAPDKAYGTPADYKEFIDKCHAEGIAVILDMVFNQSDGLHPWYQMYLPGQNPFYNLNAPHAYSVLNDWNQGYPLVQQQWKDVLQYWLKEYRVDGFRFDLVKGLGNNDSYANPDDAATNAFNQSRIDRMKELHAYMSEVNSAAYCINENLAGAQEENAMAADGELNWANVNTEGQNYAAGNQTNSGLNRMWAKLDNRTPGSTVSYLESHDEQRLAYAAKNTTQTLLKGKRTDQLKRIGSAAAQMILAPGAHMIWQFSEMGNDQSTKNPDGSNNTNPKTVNWALLDIPANKGLFESYQQLISIRRKNPELFTQEAIFTMNCASSDWTSGRTMFTSAAGKELYVVINPNFTGGALNVTVPFAKADNNAYYIVSESYDSAPTFDAAGGKVSVPANSYVVIGSQNVSDVNEIGLGGANTLTITTGKGTLHVEGATDTVEIYNLSGMLIHRELSSDFTLSLPAGLYIVKSGAHSAKYLVK